MAIWINPPNSQSTKNAARALPSSIHSQPQQLGKVFESSHVSQRDFPFSEIALWLCLFLGTPSKLWFSIWFPLKTHQTRGAFKIHDTHLYHMPAKAKQEKRTCFRSRDLGSCSSLGCALCWSDCVHKLRHTQGLSKRRELIRVIRKKYLLL